MNVTQKLSDLSEKISKVEDENSRIALTSMKEVLDFVSAEIDLEKFDNMQYQSIEYANDNLETLRKANDKFNLDDGAKLVVQLIPVETFKTKSVANDINLDLTKHYGMNLAPIYAQGYNQGVYEDGLLAYSDQYGYTKINYFGIVEMVDQSMLSYNPIPTVIFEREIIQAIKRVQEILKTTDISGKILLKIDLLNIKGQKLSVKDQYGFTDKSLEYDNDDLCLRIVTLDSIESDVTYSLKPVFDHFWRAFGYKNSKNYDENGDFIG